jgi:phage N-6-adenine-methyltransferase
MQVKISEIIITSRKRTLKTEYVKQLAESINEIGLLHPITLSSDYKLLSGMHRLEAIKLLGMETIECHVMVSGGILYEELIEIDENLIRNDFTTLERGEQLKRRKEIYEEIHPETKQGGDKKSEEYKNQTEINAIRSFAQDTAEKIGITDRTIRQEIQIARDIDDSVKDIIRDTAIADSKTELLQIAREKNPEIQKDIVDKIINKPHITYNSGNNEWYTPSEYIESARLVMGEIALDPASSELANTVVKAKDYFTIETNGIEALWHGKIWLNPPYSSDLVSKFIDKLVESYDNQDVDEAIVLVNNATETKWFQSLIEIASAICFTFGRVKYWCPEGNQGAPLQGQAIVYIGNNPIAFRDEFKKHGWVAFPDLDKLFPENL